MSNSDERKLKVYEQLCNSYRAIDDFRAKLLGFLPLATGAGIFILVNDEAKIKAVAQYLKFIGLFGFVVTLGLYCFELYGIEKCTHLIETGTELEETLGKGQFTDRPLGFLGFINEPFAAGLIYPVVLSAWAFLAWDFQASQCYLALNLTKDAKWAFWVFIGGFLVSLVNNLRLIIPVYKKRWEKSRGQKSNDQSA